jgi:hypothetical protein
MKAWTVLNTHSENSWVLDACSNCAVPWLGKMSLRYRSCSHVVVWPVVTLAEDLVRQKPGMLQFRKVGICCESHKLGHKLGKKPQNFLIKRFPNRSVA